MGKGEKDSVMTLWGPGVSNGRRDCGSEGGDRGMMRLSWDVCIGNVGPKAESSYIELLG